MKSRLLITMLALTVGLTVLAGCDTSNNELQRLVCEVQSVNAGAPLVSAYLNSGNDKILGTDDDFAPIDWIPVVFQARAMNNNMVIPENGTYSWFHITSYDLTWHPGPSAPEGLTDYNVTGGLADAIVPIDDQAVVQILVADRLMKEEPWFRQLYLDFIDPEGVPSSFTAALEITFHGHESGSEYEVSIPAGLMVTFFGVVSSE
ncbi:hypothetical protein KJ682_16895 [bacterium]|nr:hypothetical protein [bacterium]